MERMSPGARQTMHVQRTTQPYGGEIENVAYTEPVPIKAIDVRVGMVVSERPKGPGSRPRKFVVKSRGFGEKWLEVDGKPKRFQAVFFNGNGAKKYRHADRLLLHFAPEPVRDGVKTRPLKAERVTTDEEKAQNAARYAAELDELAAIIEKFGK